MILKSVRQEPKAGTAEKKKFKFMSLFILNDERLPGPFQLRAGRSPSVVRMLPQAVVSGTNPGAIKQNLGDEPGGRNPADAHEH